MSRNSPNLMHTDFKKCHEVPAFTSPKLQHHPCLRIQTTSQSVPQNAAPQVKIYPKLKIMITFTLYTLLLEIRSKGLDFKGHLGCVLLGSTVFSWLGFLVFYSEKTVFGRFGWSTSSTGIKLGWNGWKSIGSDRCRLRRPFEVGRGLLPCCFPSTCQRWEVW